LHFYMAPPAEVHRITKPMVRLLHADRETEYVALSNIATMAATYPRLFSDVVDEFFVCGSESLPTRILKLDILTRSANEQNIHRILKELKEYAKDENKTFVASAVQAIGRCATALPEVADSCMQQLVQLIVHSTSQTVAAESIIVIKRLLQMNANKESTDENKSQEKEEAERRDVSIIKQLVRMLSDDSVTIPQARAAIIWLVGEYNEKITERAPDVLRVLAKSFLKEADIVKLQVLTLGAKLVVASEPDKLQPRVLEILRYILQLAKYDVNYDIRDRARLIRLLLLPEGDATESELRKNAKALFLSEKPVPAFESVTDLCTGFVLGTLSHVIHDTAPGYRPLEDFPEVAPDPTTRNPPVVAESQPDAPAPKMGAFTGLAPGEDPDNYLFGEDEGLGDDADDGWGVGWDDEEEEGDGGKKKKSAGKAAEDDWGMGDDDWGMGGEEPKQESDDFGWDLEDDNAEAAKKEEKAAEKVEEKVEDEDDGWGIGEEEPKEEENEEKPKQKMLGDADIDESDAAPAPAPAPATEAAAPEEPAAVEEPAKEEEAPKEPAAAEEPVTASVEDGEAEE